MAHFETCPLVPPSRRPYPHALLLLRFFLRSSPPLLPALVAHPLSGHEICGATPEPLRRRTSSSHAGRAPALLCRAPALRAPLPRRLPDGAARSRSGAAAPGESHREGGARILMTPQQRKRRADPDAGADLALVESVRGATGRSPVSDRRLVLYDRPTALVPSDASGEPFDDMVCTYQYHCRQMAMHTFDPRVLECVDGASWRCLFGARWPQFVDLPPRLDHLN